MMYLEQQVFYQESIPSNSRNWKSFWIGWSFLLAVLQYCYKDRGNDSTLWNEKWPKKHWKFLEFIILTTKNFEMKSISKLTVFENMKD